MKAMKKFSLGMALVGAVLAIGACSSGGGNESKEEKKEESHSVALVTDIGGVDDKSFNQSAWEGLQSWGKANGLEKGTGGFSYYQSDSDSEYIPNLNQAINDGFKTVFGVGFKIQPALEEVAKANPDINFVIIDSTVEGHDNVLSVMFKANEAAYLAGVAAAKTTKTNKVGFIGGQEADVITLFEVGFKAGVHSVNPDIEVMSQYAGSFGDAAKGKSIAATMYSSGSDIIYHAAGDTGNGVFSEAIDVMKTNPKNKVWVIGVDRDQTEEGEYDGGNVTLTSTLKEVGQVVETISQEAMDGKFPGGELQTFGLKEAGVELTNGQISEDILTEIKKIREQIISGDIKVPETVKDFESFKNK